MAPRRTERDWQGGGVGAEGSGCFREFSASGPVPNGPGEDGFLGRMGHSPWRRVRPDRVLVPVVNPLEPVRWATGIGFLACCRVMPPASYLPSAGKPVVRVVEGWLSG